MNTRPRPARPFDEITVWPADPATFPRITIQPAAPAADPDPGVERAWGRMCAANPRLFEGPILSLADFNAATGEVVCTRETYKRLSVQDQVPTGVVLVAVNGVITAGDADGREHMLLGRRAPGTRMYPGLWELAPAGGLDPPTGPEFPAAALLAQLSRELTEETGLAEPLANPTPLAYCRDDLARSFNIVLRARVERPIGSLRPASERHWDCDAVRWLPVDEAARLDRDEPDSVIRATRALWRLLGWVR